MHDMRTPMKKRMTAAALALTAAGWAQAQNDPAPFDQVLAAIATPTLNATSYQQLLRQLAPHCKASTLPQREQYKRGNVECVAAVGAEKFAVSGEEDPAIGFIQASFKDASRCKQVKRSMVAAFGKASSTKGECEMNWKLKPLKKGGPARYAGFETSTADNKIYIAVGEEQGP